MLQSVLTPPLSKPIPMDRNWSVVAATTLGLIFSVGSLMVNTFGVFVQPLGSAFGWSRTQMSVALAVSNYSVALALPICGLLIDRIGPRTALLTSIVSLSTMVASLCLLTPNLWHYYIIFGAASFLGVAASPMGYSAVLVRRFDRHLGLALGLAMMGVGIGAAVLPPLAQALITDWGWRRSYGILGALTLIITLPAAMVATRGVQPSTSRRVSETPEAVLPLLATREFVLMCIIFLLLGILSVGALANLVPIMITRGFSPRGAAQVAGITGLAAVIGRGSIGWVLDRVHAPYVVAAAAMLVFCAFMLLGLSGATGASYLAALLLGTVVGAEVDFTAFFVRRYFSGTVFGRMYGVAFAVFVIGTGTGPLLASAGADHLGGFKPVALLFGAGALAVAVLTFAMPRYRASRLPQS